MKTSLLVAGFLILGSSGILAGQRGGGAPPNPAIGNLQAIAEGEGLYNKACITCHGADGRGAATGHALVSGDRVDIGRSDTQTFNVVKNGAPGTTMKPLALPDADIWKIVAYLHALRGPAIDRPLAGDVAHGEALFWGKGQCGACHMLSGKGGLTAPDLSNIAGVRKASSIVNALTKADHRVHDSGGAHLQEVPAVNAYLPVRVALADGTIVDGVLLNEDGYSLQMVDKDQQLRLFDKSKLRNIAVEPRSLMPTDYDKRLTPEEFKDLMAFLSRQGRTAPPPAGRGAPPQ